MTLKAWLGKLLRRLLWWRGKAKADDSQSKATESTAHHEAGHTVACYVWGVQLQDKGVVLGAKAPTGLAGCVFHERIRWDEEWPLIRSLQHEPYRSGLREAFETKMRAEIHISLAGEAASM